MKKQNKRNIYYYFWRIYKKAAMARYELNKKRRRRDGYMIGYVEDILVQRGKWGIMNKRTEYNNAE